MDAIKFVHEQITKENNHPEFRSGDNVVVSYKIIEGDKERIQDFRGDVIQIKGNGATKTFTVRKMSSGVGVERIFPILSPSIEKIEVLRKGKVRRARLFYLRGRQGKAAKIKELKKIQMKPFNLTQPKLKVLQEPIKIPNKIKAKEMPINLYKKKS